VRSVEAFDAGRARAPGAPSERRESRVEASFWQRMVLRTPEALLPHMSDRQHALARRCRRSRRDAREKCHARAAIMRLYMF